MTIIIVLLLYVFMNCDNNTIFNKSALIVKRRHSFRFLNAHQLCADRCEELLIKQNSRWNGMLASGSVVEITAAFFGDRFEKLNRNQHWRGDYKYFFYYFIEVNSLRTRLAVKLIIKQFSIRNKRANCRNISWRIKLV